MQMCDECYKIYDESEYARCPFCTPQKRDVQIIYTDEKTGEVKTKPGTEKRR